MRDKLGRFVKGNKPSAPFKKGHSTWNKGISYRAGVPKPWKEVRGKDNPLWKGDDVGYRGLHMWVQQTLGTPNKCSNCSKKGNGHKMHWANKSRTYKRKISDWIRLCAKCHKEYDKNKILHRRANP